MLNLLRVYPAFGICEKPAENKGFSRFSACSHRPHRGILVFRSRPSWPRNESGPRGCGQHPAGRVRKLSKEPANMSTVAERPRARAEPRRSPPPRPPSAMGNAPFICRSEAPVTGCTRSPRRPASRPSGRCASSRRRAPPSTRSPSRRAGQPGLHVPGLRDQRRRVQAHRVAEGPRPHPRPEGPPGGRPPQPCPPPRRAAVARPGPGAAARRSVRRRLPVRRRPGSPPPSAASRLEPESFPFAACGEAFDPAVSRDPHFCGPCAEEGATNDPHIITLC